MERGLSMWGKAITSLVKVERKEEWDRLDVVSKWLIATRSGVTTVTLYTCLVAGLLAWREGYFAPLPWLIVTLGLFLAHGAHNILNDYTDFRRGVDVVPYFRTQYGAHPLAQGFWTKRQQLTWFVATGIPAFLTGVFALVYTNFSPAVIALFAFGAVMLLIYTWPIKSIALGELSIFLIWGPVMASGVYLVLSQGNADALWKVALAAIPFGLSVVSINIGKHIDKSAEDRVKRIGTLPVVVGEAAARYINIAVIAFIYLVMLTLIFITRWFTPALLIVFAAGLRAFIAIRVHTQPRPPEPPKEWPAWPTWFAGFAFYHNQLFSNLLILGMVLDLGVRMYFPGFWPAG